MKFSINKSELQNAMSVVLKGSSPNSTTPALSGVLLDVHDDRVAMQTTNLELSVQYSTTALVEEEGKTVVPGRLFSDIVKSLADAAVSIEADDTHASITCDTASFSIKTIDPVDFPEFPKVDVAQQLEIPFSTFSSMVKRVAHVVSKDETRAVLTGVLITYEEENEKVRMVATDSYRLAITEADLPAAQAHTAVASSADQTPNTSDSPAGAEASTSAADQTMASSTPGETSGFQAVVSGTFLSDVISLPKTESPICIALAENQIVVTIEDTVFVNRRIEGTFPNYQQLIPETYGTRATFDVETLTAAVKRVSLLGSSTSPIKLDLNDASQTAQLSATSQDVGTAQETMRCEIEGENAEIAFNHMYVLDGLAALEGESVYLEVQSPLKPGVFRAASPGEDYLYLVMPVRSS